MSDFETKTLTVTTPGSLFASYLTVDVCQTCFALVFDKEKHHMYHAWPHMTVGQKLAYAKRRRAAGEDDAWSDSIMRRDL